MFADIFLSKSELEKVKVLQTIALTSTNSWTLNDLATKLNYSYQKTYNTFQALVDDLALLFPQITNIKERLQNSQYANSLLVAYQRSRLIASTPFQVLNYLLTTPHPQVEFFLEQHYLSKSTLLRKIQRLKYFLHNYDIQFSFNTFSLKGTEVQIRLFLYSVYWLCYQGQEWPFSHSNRQTILDLINDHGWQQANPIVTEQLAYFIAISRTRTAMGHFLILNSNWTCLSQSVPDYQPLTLSDLPLSTPQQLNEENKVLTYFLLCHLNTLPISRYCFKLPQADQTAFKPLEEFSDRLYIHLRIEFPEARYTRAWVDPILFNHIQQLVLSYYLLEHHVPTFDDFNPSTPALPPGITRFYHCLANYLTQQTTLNLKDNFVLLNSLFKIFQQHFLFIQPQETVKLTLILAYNANTNFPLAHALRTNPLCSLQTDTHHLEDTDLVITSEMGAGLYWQRQPHSHYKIYVWNPLWSEDFGTQQLQDLQHVIHHIFIEKNQPH